MSKESLLPVVAISLTHLFTEDLEGPGHRSFQNHTSNLRTLFSTTSEDRFAEIQFRAETGDLTEGMFEVVSQNTPFRQFLRSMFRIRLSYRALYYQAQLQSGVLTVRTDRAKLPETDRPQSDRASPLPRQTFTMPGHA
jgi:hypothetical protein